MNAKSLYRILLFSVLFVGCFGHLMAQKQDTTAKTSFWSNWKAEAHFGSTFFYGDISDNNVMPYPRDWRLGYGLTLTKYINPNWGVRGHFVNGKLAGKRKELNSYFSNSFFELSLQTTYNLASLFWTPGLDYRYSVYGIFGGGLMNYNASRYQIGTGNIMSNETADPTNKDAATMQGNLSGGLGADFNLTDNLHFVLETSFFGLNSDKLDGYIGSSGKNDVFQYTSLGLGYSFDFAATKTKKAVSTERSTSWNALRTHEALSAASENQKTEIISQNLDESAAAQQVDIVCWVPSEIKEGEAFPISFEILKKDLQGKAEIKIVLPENFTAIEQQIPDAVFVPLNQNVTIRMSKLPATQEVPVQFKIKSNKAPAGNYTLYIMGKITDQNGKQYKFSTVSSFKQLAIR